MKPLPDQEDAPSTSAVAPGAITALLRDVFRLPSVEGRDALPEYRPGQVIGRFELVRELGRGGFGVVYEATDRQLRRKVALKAVRMGGDVGLKEERLLREAEAAAQLTHPNIVTLFDLGTFDRGPYLVLELLRGGTLAERLRGGALQVGEALRIAVDVAKAVAHAHAQGVIHRDLTAGNVFLCDDGNVKVLDFGMAQAFGHHRVHGGTVAYMAPEQYRGESEDERTDVFALGVMLHEMLTGGLPFRDAAALASADPAPAVEAAGCPPLGALVGRMLAKDPGQRPRDGREVLGALRECRRLLGAAPRRARRAALVAGAAAAVGALVLAGVTLSRGAGGRGSHEPVRSLAALPVAVPAAPPVPTPAPAAPAAAGAPGTAPPAPRQTPAAVPRVRFCRGTIGAIPTPDATTGDGVLTVEADPYGDVWVNGRPQGETPLECQAPAGTYAIRVAHPKLGVRERRVRVSAGGRAPWVADFLQDR